MPDEPKSVAEEWIALRDSIREAAKEQSLYKRILFNALRPILEEIGEEAFKTGVTLGFDIAHSDMSKAYDDGRIDAKCAFAMNETFKDRFQEIAQL